MNISENDNIINESDLFEYFNGACSPKKVDIIERWIKASDENKTMAKRVQALSVMVRTERNLRNNHQALNLEKAKQRISKNRRRVSLRRSLEIAAAVLLLPLTGWLSYSYLTNNKINDSIVEVRMAPGMIGTILLPDSSQVWLNSNSTLRYPAHFGGDKREVTLNGEGYFKVSKDKKHRFVVNTPRKDVKIEVLGTEFNIDAYAANEFISTTLVNGKVKLYYTDSDNHENSVFMEPNDKMVYNKCTSTLKEEKSNLQSSISWRNDQVVLNETPLQDVLWILSKRFNVEFEVHNKTLLEHNFTGTFKNVSLKRVLEYFNASSQIKHRTESNDSTEIEKIILY